MRSGQNTRVPNTMIASCVGDWLRAAEQRLNSRLEAELLAGHALARDRSWLYAHADHELRTSERHRLDALLMRRLAGEPVAYILGEWEFYTRSFRITPSVLIPRPETELIVELALDLDLPERARVAELGAGSGCIALTLAAERPDWRVCAVESNPDALAVTRENRAMHQLDWVELIGGDLFAPLRGRAFDLVVSNPPYVAEDDPHLDLGDVRFEPGRALVAGPDGLDVIRRIVEQAPDYLAPGGRLLIEHGYDQADAVAGLLRKRGFSGIESHADLAGIPRAARAAWNAVRE